MKIFGIFRGFPGLGSAVAGAGILNMLKSRGHEVKAYSYLQGNAVLAEYGLDRIIDKKPDKRHIMIIGLNPISVESGILIDKILDENPDLVILDGEPLLVSTLAMVFPRTKILSLLNPTDIENQSLPMSSLKFYRNHYLSAGCAFVHGLSGGSYAKIGKNYSCEIFSIRTILRPNILNYSISASGTSVVGILGGGSENASPEFLNSTVAMGRKIISLASYLPHDNFFIYCNDMKICSILCSNLPDNIKVIGKYVSPEKIYANAKVVLCRAGRNTVSELLFLKIPAMLFSTAGDFRSTEQDKNIDDVCLLSGDLMKKCHIDDSVEYIANQLYSIANELNVNYKFTPGNEKILKFIENM